ncbi:SAM-dependent methyltransferase, partial [Mesorhizobium sp. SARCC-RB16n]|uniref:SAM-dependent methyltransferase n=1 Tax=Mesorhizobium sp. SARCC-RB16n TaxID=2116687 RepID=UPI00122F4A7A
MVFRLKERLGRKFEEEVQFFRCWQKDKKAVGALMTTSVHAARHMARIRRRQCRFLSLVPEPASSPRLFWQGGVEPQHLVSIEYSKDCCDRLRQRCPDVDVRLGDVFLLDLVLPERNADKFDCVISAVPMLSFPMERRTPPAKAALRE